jgi:hypothetical protein
LIPYDETQEALRAVVGRVLGEIQRTAALAGQSPFYITFKTGALFPSRSICVNGFLMK